MATTRTTTPSVAPAATCGSCPRRSTRASPPHAPSGQICPPSPAVSSSTDGARGAGQRPDKGTTRRRTVGPDDGGITASIPCPRRRHGQPQRAGRQLSTRPAGDGTGQRTARRSHRRADAAGRPSPTVRRRGHRPAQAVGGRTSPASGVPERDGRRRAGGGGRAQSPAGPVPVPANDLRHLGGRLAVHVATPGTPRSVEYVAAAVWGLAVWLCERGIDRLGVSRNHGARPRSSTTAVTDAAGSAPTGAPPATTSAPTAPDTAPPSPDHRPGKPVDGQGAAGGMRSFTECGDPGNREPNPIRTELPHPHPDEADLYADLLTDRYAPGLRLEQERVRHDRAGTPSRKLPDRWLFLIPCGGHAGWLIRLEGVPTRHGHIRCVSGRGLTAAAGWTRLARQLNSRVCVRGKSGRSPALARNGGPPGVSLVASPNTCRARESCSSPVVAHGSEAGQSRPRRAGRVLTTAGPERRFRWSSA